MTLGQRMKRCRQCGLEAHSQSGGWSLCALHMGRHGNRIGRIGEEMTRDAVIALGLSWVTCVRLATRQEDAHGIDVVCETDLGPLWLQVKTSSRPARRAYMDHVIDGVRASPGADQVRLARDLLVVLEDQWRMRQQKVAD